MLLRAVPAAVLTVLALPVGAGLVGTLAPALRPGAWAGLADWQGLPRAVWLSVWTGGVSTALSLGVTLVLLAALRDTRALSLLVRLLSPLLSVPHAAAALGLAFLIAPSGWIARAVSPWATGWTVPPDLLIVNDPGGMALILGLVAKEVPFLLLMSLAALPQTDAARRILLARSLGHGDLAAFGFGVLPALYRQLRLPVYAVLAYGMTSVDMGQILGPTLPPPLSVQLADWMADPDLARRDTAAAGAVVQLGLVLAVLAAWRGAEAVARQGLIRLAQSGRRFAGADGFGRAVARGAAGLLTGVLLFGLLSLAVWSVAGPWTFPDALPDRLTLATWMRAGESLSAAAGVTLALAALTAVAATALTLAGLEAGERHGLTFGPMARLILWLPLLVPQIAFLPGLQALTLRAGLPPFAATALGHLTFALPYAVLSLAPAWAAYDRRLQVLAATLGASPARVFWSLRLPMLLRPVLTAAAVAAAVSVGQYLPTLLLSGGRIATLTTEAVALSSGGNRQLIGAYAILQMLIPALAFGLALGLPAFAFRNRKGMAP